MASLLLNWRVWAAVLLCIAQAAFGWKMYRMGGNAIQGAFDAYKTQQSLDVLAAVTAAREQEHTLQSANQKVNQNYASLKTATATAVGALDADRMRLQAALDAARTAPGDPTPQSGTDATPKERILGECINRRAEVAGDAQVLSDQVKGLQDYVHRVVPHE